jgi:hypothetical protein
MRTAEQLQESIETEAALDDTGLLRWHESGNAVPSWTWKEAYGEAMPANMLARYEAHTAEVLGRYVARERTREISDEERFEMRAAFGAGTTVVNALTGRRTKV